MKFNDRLLRTARAYLGIEQQELAKLSGLSLPTIKRMEGPNDRFPPSKRSVDKLLRYYKSEGILLIETESGIGIAFPA